MSFTASFVWSDSEILENDYSLFRNVFDLTQPPKTCKIKISADKYYRLYINGKHICRGPQRSGLDYRYYDMLDIASYLQPGRNIIAAIVWYYNIYGFDYMKGAPGFLFEGSIDSFCLNTGETGWKCVRCEAFDQHPTRFSVCLPFAEYIDLNKFPENFINSDFDDSSWSSPYVLGIPPVGPWQHMIQRDINFLYDKLEDTPVQLIDGFTINESHVAYTLDLGLSLGWYPLMDKEAILSSYIKVDKKINMEMHLIFDGNLNVYLNGVKQKFTESNLGWGYRKVDLQLDNGQNRIQLHHKKGGYFWFIHYCMNHRSLLFSQDGISYQDNLENWHVTGPFDSKQSNIFQETTILKGKLYGKKSLPVRFNPAIRVTTEARRNALDLTDRFIPRITATSNDSYHIIWDFGAVVTGFPVVDFECQQEGVQLDFSYSEILKDGYVLPAPYGSLNFTDTLYTRKGHNRYEPNFLFKGFRYLGITVRHPVSPVSIQSVRLNRYHYDVQSNATFACSDPLLKQIWDMGEYTLKCCMSDAYMDCPSREQAFYSGDLTTELLTNFYTFADAKLAASNLRSTKLNQYAQGFFPSVSPRKDGDGSDILLDQNLDIITNTLNYTMFTGDLTVAQDLYPCFFKLIDACNTFLNHRNLLENVNVPIWIDHLLWDIYENGIQSAINVRFYKALSDFSKLCEILRLYEQSTSYLLQSEKLKTAINTHLRNKDGIYINGILSSGCPLETISIQVNSMAAAYSIAPVQDIPHIASYLFSHPDQVIQSKNPYFYYFIHKLMFKANMGKDVIDQIRNKWGEFIEQGHRTIPETWGEWYVSMCHAYSTAPNITIAEEIMGIEPLSPGFETFRISPRTELLVHARYEMQIPQGKILIDFNNENNTLSLRIPNNCIGYYLNKTREIILLENEIINTFVI